MKKQLTLWILASLFMPTLAFANDLQIKVTNPDDVVYGIATTPFQEGTQTELSKEQVSVLSNWAKTTRSVLEAYVETAKTLRVKSEIVSTLKEGIQNAVLASRKQKTELLMRYVLNRGLTILEVMEHETSTAHVGIEEAKIRLLEQSIQMAQRYYDHDLSYLAKLDPANVSTLKIDFAQFGVTYASFLSSLSNSVFDASAQYQLYRLTLGLLQMDLYRDTERFKYAEAINKINVRLQSLPKSSPMDDQSALALIRNAKKTLGSLNLQIQRATSTPVATVPATPIFNNTPTPRYQVEDNSFTDKTLSVGTRVFSVDYSRWGQITAITYKGDYIVQFSSGSSYTLSRSGLAVAKGCNDLICVGDRVFSTSYSRWGNLVALQMNGTYILQFSSGSAYTHSRNEVAAAKGCSRDLCVGAKVYSTSYSRWGTITAIEKDGDFVVEMSSGSSYSHDRESLAVGQ